MTKEEILNLADEVTADMEGYSYLRHGEEPWLLEFAERLQVRWEIKREKEK